MATTTGSYSSRITEGQKSKIFRDLVSSALFFGVQMGAFLPSLFMAFTYVPTPLLSLFLAGHQILFIRVSLMVQFSLNYLFNSCFQLQPQYKYRTWEKLQSKLSRPDCHLGFMGEMNSARGAFVGKH